MLVVVVYADAVERGVYAGDVSRIVAVRIYLLCYRETDEHSVKYHGVISCRYLVVSQRLRRLVRWEIMRHLYILCHGIRHCHRIYPAAALIERYAPLHPEVNQGEDGAGYK